MKTPLALILAAAVAAAPAAPVFAADTAAASGPKDRCDVTWLKNAQVNLQNGIAQTDPGKYLTTEPVPGDSSKRRPVLDIVNAPALCDATVWHSLAVLAPVSGEVILDPKTHQPIGGVTLAWNDPNLQKDWAANGLGEQVKILLAVNELYKGVDAMGAAVLTAADAVVAAGVTSGAVVKTDGANPSKLQKDGYTTAAYASVNGYTVAPPAQGAAAAAAPADMKAAFSQLLADGPAPAPAKPAVAGPPSPKPLTAGPALLAYRRAVIVLANELAVRSGRRDLMQKAGVDASVTADFVPKAAAASAAKAALVGPGGTSTIPADLEKSQDAYAAALKFVTDPAITAADDESTHDSAALSSLDYGLRNLIAVRAAAADAAVASAKKMLNGRGVAETLAAMDQAPADKGLPAGSSIADAVTARISANPDFQKLNALFDANKSNPDWLKSPDGVAATARKAQILKDAAATAVGPDGKLLSYTVRGQAITDTNIRVADIQADPAYKTAIVDLIASTIVTNNLQGKIDAVGAAVLDKPITPKLTPDQTRTAAALPAKNPPPPPPPAPPYQALLAATPAGILGAGSNDHVARYYSKVNAAAAEAASRNATARTRIEAQANAAADAVRKNHNPDDSADVVARNAQAAHDKVISEALAAKTYVPAPAPGADVAARAALDKQVEAAYADGIGKTADSLAAQYKQAGSKRRKAMEFQTGYTGQWYKTERVDAYFAASWGGAARGPKISACMGQLGYKAGGDPKKFMDPNDDDVDDFCQVRSELKAYLRSFTGGNGKPVPPPAATK